MHGRHRRYVLAALIALATMAATLPAAAFMGESPPTHRTAYTLKDHEFRLSLWSLDYGLTDRLQLNTVHLLDAMGILNAGVKYQFWRGDTISWSAQLELVHLDFDRWPFDSADAQLIVVPVTVNGSWAFADAWRLHWGALLTKVTLRGAPDGDEFRGAAGVDNLQAQLGLHYQFKPRFALYAHSQHLVAQSASGRVDTTQTLDSKTTVRIVAEGESDAIDYGGAHSLVIGGIYAEGPFHIRAGIGRGNWSLPVINFVLPGKSTIVDLDVYWRF